MTVSGSNNFNLTRNQIINKALAIIGVKSRARAATAEEINDASEVLNMMIKNWKSKGQYLWKTHEATLFLVAGQAKYTLDGSSANATESFNQTTTAADAASGASSVDVTSTTGFVVGYNIGIAQDNNTIHWTTISSIASNTITLASNLTAAAASGNSVFVYQTKISRPEKVNSCRLRYTNTGPSDVSLTDVMVTEVARSTYFEIPNKNAQGKANQYFYDKQLTFGDIYIYPTPDVVTDTVKFTFEKQFFDFDTAVDDPDFPQEWLMPLAMNLAYWLSYEYGISAERSERIKRDAEQLLADSEGYDRESTSIYFQPQTIILGDRN